MRMGDRSRLQPILRGSLTALACLLSLWLAIPAATSRLATARTDSMDTPASGDAGFSQFVVSIGRDAIARGVPRATWTRIASHLTWQPSLLAKTSTQPEHTRSTGEYVRALVSDGRIAEGRAMLSRHGDLLRAIETRFGVDRHILLAIWGIETNYGAHDGGHNVLAALATLAYADTRRASFWRGELLAAIDIAAKGDIAPAAMVGSWAGAMGHTQFMPTTYARYAVDFDGDGRRNLWSSAADALASAAAYLARSGWRRGEPWAFEVQLPAHFDFAHADPSARLPVEAWQVLGLTPPAGGVWPRTADLLSLALPAGAGGPALLTGTNHRVIRRYNASRSYQLAVGLLAHAIAGAPPLKASWPAEDRGLAREERLELQERLSALGHDPGGVDAVLGSRTRDAIRDFQRTRGLPADGHPSLRLLHVLRGR